MELIDLCAATPDRVEASLCDVRQAMIQKGPRTDRWPLFEARAHLLPGARVRFHVSLSLITLDLLSVKLLADELVALYRAPEAPLAPFELSFRDYVLAMAAHRDSESYRRSEEYWRNRLADIPPAPDLPLAMAPGSLREPARFVRRAMRLDEATWARLQANATRAGVFPAMALCAAYCAVLARWSKAPRFTLNLLNSQRLPIHPQVKDLPANFSATTLLVVDTASATSFEDFARAVQQQRLADRAHDIVSGVWVLRELNRIHHTGSQATMPVVFNSLIGVFDGDKDWLAHELFGALQTPQVYLDHQVMPRGHALDLYWDTVDALFPAGVVDAMFGAYREILQQLADVPSAWKRPPNALIRTHASPPAHGEEHLPHTGTLHGHALAHAAQQPNSPAIISSRRTLGHGELAQRAQAVAAWLRDMDARPGELVAVVMDKGWEQPAAVLGVNLSGAAYLPIEASLPPERIHHLLARGAARLVLTQRHVDDRLTWPQGSRRLCIDDMDMTHASGGSADEVSSARDLAYVIFTSGSTGQPKGVMIDHRGAVNTIVDINRRFEVTAQDRVLAVSSLGFDLSVYDIFGLLAAGGVVVIPDAGDVRDPERLAAWLHDHHITIWNSVPATMEMLVEHLASRGQRLPSSLRLVLLSGDWIPVTLPDRIRSIGDDVSVISLGGATEASIWSIFYPIERVAPGWTSIPYGKPLTAQDVVVLDHALQPRPTWVPGELYISGAGVALGYWQDQEQTAARFVNGPSGHRLYRTGDWGRYLPDGNIEFLGREDFQVKVHGFRIELGEIEGTLEQHPSVRVAAVSAVGERMGSKSLVAYVVPLRGAPVDGDELREYLQERLPWYMVPTTYMLLEQLPLSANDKVDRRQLPAPDAGNHRRGEHLPPRDALERRLLDLWEQLLDARPIGVTDRFFELGGNSLLAVRLSALLRRELGQDLPVSRMFEASTIADMAALLRRADQGASSTLVAVQPGGSRRPLFLVHPVGGNVLCYAALARQLGADQPVFALRARGLDGNGNATSKVEDMAADYIAEILAAQPRGPYLLGGWSMGGIIAVEMAAQLEAAGRTAAGVVLLDSLLPPPDADTSLPVLLDRFLHDLGVSLERRQVAQEQLAHMDVARCLDQMWGAADGDLPTADTQQLFDVFAENMRALNRFVPRPCAAPTLFIKATTFSFEPGWRSLGQVLGSSTITELHELACDHFTMLTEPHVNRVAELMASFLATRQPGGDA